MQIQENELAAFDWSTVTNLATKALEYRGGEIATAKAATEARLLQAQRDAAARTAFPAQQMPGATGGRSIMPMVIIGALGLGAVAFFMLRRKKGR